VGFRLGGIFPAKENSRKKSAAMNTKVDTKPNFCRHQDGQLRTKGMVPKKGFAPYGFRSFL
jgi:hypothetical protein